MSAPTEASQLAHEALALWEAGELSKAEGKYRLALALAPPDHWATSLVRGQWAAVLSQLDRDDEALDQWAQTLADELRAAGNEEGGGVRSTRYFFAKHLLKMGLAQAALEMIAPLHGQSCEWLVKELEGDALMALGRSADAREAFEEGVRLTRTDEQRESLKARLAGLRDDPSGAVTG